MGMNFYGSEANQGFTKERCPIVAGEDSCRGFLHIKLII